MAKLAIKKASTDVTTYVFIQDSSKTTGEGLAGLAYNTASLVASYVRPLGTRQAITLATLAAADSAHSDGGFKEVDATNMPGVYRLDLPDAVCATGVNSVVVMLKGATNMSPVVLEIQLTDFDLNTAAITAAAVADAVWDEATADHTTASSFGSLDANVDAILADTGTDGVVLKAAGLNADAVAEIQSGLALEATLTAIKGAGWTNETLAAIDVLIDAIKSKTDALDNSAVTFVTAVSGSTITILRGDTFSGVLTNIGALTDYVSIDFTVKRSRQEADDDAIIRIRKNATGLTDGLVRLNGAAYTTGTDGSITITDAATGDVTIMLKAGVTDDLVPGSYVYDIQLIEAAKVTTLTTGGLVVTADVTRLVA